MEPEEKKEPRRAFIGGEEVGGGGPIRIRTDIPSGRYIERAGELHEVVRKDGRATEVKGFGKVIRSGNRIVGFEKEDGSRTNVEGDLGDLDQ